MKKLTKIALSAGLAMLSTSIYAKSIYISGSIKSVSPKVEVVYPDEMYRGVEEYTAIAKELANSGCTLHANQPDSYTTDSGDLKCFFEWTGDTDDSWLPNGFNAEGRPLGAAGEHTRSYRISYFSGTSKEKVTIVEDSVTYTLLEPPAPVLVDVNTTSTTSSGSGLVYVSHNSVERLKTATVEVEERPYDQVVHLTQFNQSCSVPKGETQCELNIGDIGFSEDKSITGEVFTSIKVTDKYDFISTPVEQLRYAWDYRPPVIEQFAYKATGNDENSPVVITVENQTLELANNEAVIVITSPHSADYEERWWLPTSVTIDFTADEEIKQVSDFITLDGVDIRRLFQDTKISSMSGEIRSLGQPQQIGDSFVYRVPLGSVNDGQYLTKVEASDIFSNTGELIDAEMELDRLPPQIRLYNKWAKFDSGDEINFIEHMVITVQDDTSTENEILGIMLDGEPVEFAGEFPQAKYITTKVDWQSNTAHSITVQARDKNNNYVETTHSISFLPLDYIFKNIDDLKVAHVQNQDITYDQNKGKSCKLYNSDRLAIQSINNDSRMACSVKWTLIPDGLEEAWDTSTPKLIGAFSATGAATIAAEIYVHDYYGRTNLIKTDSTTLIVKEPITPEILFEEKDMFSFGYNAVELGNYSIGRYRIRASSSPLDITIFKNGQTLEDYNIAQSRRYAEHTISKTINDKNSANNRRLWQEDVYEVQVKYARQPENVVSNSIIAYTVPSRKARLLAEQSEVEMSTSDELSIKTKFGIYSSFYRDVVYEDSKLGEWQVRIAVQDENKELAGLTEWQTVSDSGQNNFDINFDHDEIGDLRYYAQSRVVSPNPAYEASVISSRSTVKVLKGTAIEGNMKTIRITGSLPLSASVRYDYLSADDKRASAGVVWYMSDNNGASWQKYSDGTRFSYVARSEGTWLVRAEITNRFTGEVSHTDQVQVMAYRVPQLTLEGASNLISGMTGTYTVYDQGELADAGNLLIEWSTDGGMNFESGSETFEYEADRLGSNQIVVRAAYIGYESDEKSWGIKKKSVRTQIPKPVRIRVNSDKDIETTMTLPLVATVTAPYTKMETDIVTEWVLPDGTVIPGDTFDFTPTEEDLAIADVHRFTMRAWLDGYKAMTYNEYDHQVQVWKYQFPQYTMAYTQDVKVAPSLITIWLRRPAGANLRENLNFDWDGRGRLELTKDWGIRARFKAKNPGIYPISVVASDDRGNWDEFTEYVEVIEAEPISVDLTEYFSNTYRRYPLDVMLRPTIRGGHPDDRVADYRWYLNGELQPELERSYAKFEKLDEGEHILTLKVTTKFGQESEASVPIEVLPNIPPVCSLSYRLINKTAQVSADCKDVDGKIVRYDWKLGDYERNNVGSRISALRQPGETELAVVTGYDDSGDSHTAQLLIQW
ncbi:hypothetical protein J4N45_11250 [Vibrio sp. SCSIO 43140]|uniref:Ig-like domain-containing protein n=1 Tax=Vibrio sp. SCSIO 43140 TaxID=2819100 RepID=UPI0020764344|nr:Ig-like domain-containing protein [Vibrio sp. SCSIO 43140]USD59108.1 hypothetical protein J4N45_11250 [Vibrio sp. SCSIO 43140]